MNIKKQYTIILLAATTLFSAGCNKWLDVQPHDQVSDEKLFADAMGFRNALNGIYQLAADAPLFGRSLTWGFNSMIAQDYATTGSGTSNQVLQQVAQYNYTDSRVQPVISDIWSSAYNAIANSNKLISEVEASSPDMFPMGEVERDLILGEAIAMRGLLHFELLRLFAPAPAQDMQGAYMPYQEDYPKHYIPPAPTSDILDLIIRDLNQAKDLVAPHDTIVNPAGLSAFFNRLQGATIPEGGMFFAFRLSRLNLNAIQGLLARVHLYAGDRESALEEAMAVYEYGPHGAKKYYAFTPQSNTQGTALFPKLANDLILALYDRELISKIASFRSSASMPLNQAVSTWLPANERDFRANLVNADRTSAKWIESTSSSQYVAEQNLLLPVLRMSEIYYILSECLYESGDVQGALRVLNEVRQGRGRTDVFTDTDREAFYAELLAEYRREFLAEGQTVFAHKRLGRSMTVGTRIIEMSNAHFVLPVPEGEIIL